MSTFELFRSENLRVYGQRWDDQSHEWLVTFDHWKPVHDIESPGFGEHFAEARRINAIFFKCRTNRWWLYPEMVAALAAVHNYASERGRVTTYGSSMGGYAAIRFADALHACTAIAVSPQYSIDPQKVPWENRYDTEARIIDFKCVVEPDQPVATDCRYIAMYDNTFGLDVKQMKLLVARWPITQLRLPLGGHPAHEALAQAGILPNVISSLIADTYDSSSVRSKMRATRRMSDRYWLELSHAFQRRNRFSSARQAALNYSRLAQDKDYSFKWTFARADQMGLPFTDDEVDDWSEPDREIAIRLLSK